MPKKIKIMLIDSEVISDEKDTTLTSYSYKYLYDENAQAMYEILETILANSATVDRDQYLTENSIERKKNKIPKDTSQE